VGGAGGKEGSAGRVGGTGRRDGRRRARARKQSSYHPGVSVHTEKMRPRHPPDPTCRPTAGERVWWDWISVPPPAGALAAHNWSPMRTDLGPCVSSCHVEPVHSGAVPARQNLKRAGGTSLRDPPAQPDHADPFRGGDQTNPRHTRWTDEGPIAKRWTAEGPIGKRWTSEGPRSGP